MTNGKILMGNLINSWLIFSILLSCIKTQSVVNKWSKKINKKCTKNRKWSLIKQTTQNSWLANSDGIEGIS